MPTGKADYILALLREVQRLHPPPGSHVSNHGITWEHTDSGDILVLLVCVGDALWKYRTNPADLSDDPVETAARLVAQFKDRMKTDNDPANYL